MYPVYPIRRWSIYVVDLTFTSKSRVTGSCEKCMMEANSEKHLKHKIFNICTFVQAKYLNSPQLYDSFKEQEPGFSIRIHITLNNVCYSFRRSVQILTILEGNWLLFPYSKAGASSVGLDSKTSGLDASGSSNKSFDWIDSLYAGVSLKSVAPSLYVATAIPLEINCKRNKIRD